MYCKEEKREFILEINRSEHGRGVQISVIADFMLQCGNSFVEFYNNSEDSHKLRSFWCISGSVREVVTEKLWPTMLSDSIVSALSS